jgi:hypothetical protein
MTKTDAFPSELSRPFAHSINSACRASSFGRTSIYAAIKEGKLIARKMGSRTVILDEDLQAWLRSLPCTQSVRTIDDAGRRRPAGGDRP